LHPSKRSWTFDEDPIPLINPVPTAKSFRSDDSLAQFREIKTGHSRYSVEEEEEQEEREEPQQVVEEKEEAAKEDKYLAGAHRIDLWSDDSDSMHARWRSQSGETASPAKGGSPAKNRMSPMTRLSPRWFQRESSPKAPIPAVSQVVGRESRGKQRSSRELDVRDPSPALESTDDRHDKLVTTSGSDRSKTSSSRSRKERAPKPEDVQTRGRKGRGEQNARRQEGDNAKTSSNRADEKPRGDSEDISDRSKNTKTSKHSRGSRSSKTSSAHSAADGTATNRHSKKSGRSSSGHRNTYDQSKMSRSALSKQLSQSSKKEEIVTKSYLDSVDPTHRKSADGGTRSKLRKADDAAPSIFDNLTSLNESDMHPSRPIAIQGIRYLEENNPTQDALTGIRYLEENNPTQDALTDLRASEVENTLYQPIPIRQQEPNDHSTISLLRKDVLILKSEGDLPNKDRDPPVDADHEEKRYDPPTGKSWTSTDVASSLTGSLPVQTAYVGKDKAAYSAFLPVHTKADPVAVLRQEECEASFNRMIKPINTENPMVLATAVARDSSFPKQRVRSGVIYPPAMKGLDPPSAAIPADYPVEFNPIRSANVRAEPVASQPLVDRDEPEEPIEYSFKQSLIELCEPVAYYLLDGIRAVRNIDNGSCDEPFTFLDCKALECENENANNKKSTATNHESTLQVLEAKSMKLDEETPVNDPEKEEKALHPLSHPDLAPGDGGILKNVAGLPISMIEIPTPKSFIIDDDSYSRSILGLEKLPKPPSSPKDVVRPPTPPRGHKSKGRHNGKDSGQQSDKDRPHKRSHSKERKSRSKSEEKSKRPRPKSTERVRFDIPEPGLRVDRKTKKKGFFGKLFRMGR
jgi:hypothetical protein